MQAHLRHVGLDLRDLDPVVDVHGRLRDARHVRPAMRARLSQDVSRAGRVRMQRAMRPGMRRSLGLAARLFVGLLAARGRQGRVVRRLRRQLQLLAQRRILSPQRRVLGAQHRVLALEFLHPRGQSLDLPGQRVHPPEQLRDQRILLAPRQGRQSRRQAHSSVDSYLSIRRQCSEPDRVNPPHPLRTLCAAQLAKPPPSAITRYPSTQWPAAQSPARGRRSPARGRRSPARAASAQRSLPAI